MANVTITQLPQAGPITGTESVPIVQNGQTVQTTTAAIAASPSQTQTFLTVNQEATLPNSRYFSTGLGLGLADGGAQSFYRINLNRASGSLEAALIGFVAKDSASSVVSRFLQVSGSGLNVANGNGVSGNPIFSLTGQVASLANASGAGLVALPNNGSVIPRTITGTTNQIDVADGNGASGNPTVSLASNAIFPGTEAVTVPIGTDSTRPGAPTNGMIRYNTDLNSLEGYAAGAWGQIVSGYGVVSVNASGGTTGLTFSGGPITSAGVLTLGGVLDVAHGGTGAVNLTGYVKGSGTSAFTASSTIPSSDVTGLGSMAAQNANSVSITGGTASGIGITSSTINGTSVGALTPSTGAFTSVAMTSGTVANAPVSGSDIVNKTYADAIASGINFHQSCSYATTTALPATTYNNGSSGVGATLTATANGALVIDGHTFVSPADDNKRVLIKNEATAAYNGVYTVTQTGDAGLPFILTRATDFDSSGVGVDQIDAGDFFLITAGTANANTSWVQQTPLPITVGVTGIVFAQFGAPLVYSAGTGLNESPTYTFNIANTGVSAATYGSASSVSVIAVNAQGQITSASNSSIAIAASQITSGTLPVAQGGTNLASYTTGDLLYATDATTLAKLAIGASTYVLTSTGTAPQYVAQSTLSVGSATTATTATTATNLGGGAASQIPYQSAVGTTAFIPNGTAGQVLTSAGAGTPVWAGISGGTF